MATIVFSTTRNRRLLTRRTPINALLDIWEVLPTVRSLYHREGSGRQGTRAPDSVFIADDTDLVRRR